MSDALIQIDGSQGEGGGQVLRTASALAAVTGTPVHLTNIRANRRNPGLAPQHLAGLIATAKICDGMIRGAGLRSREILFEPGNTPQPGEYLFDIPELAGTPSAGSVTMLLQSTLLPLALAPGESHVTIRGGTHVNWSPPVHYVQWVLLPVLARMGVEAQCDLTQWGWYPEGGGEIQVTIGGGASLRGVDLTERGDLLTVEGVGAATGLSSHIPQRITARANNLLQEAGMPGTIMAERSTGISKGAGLFTALLYENARAGFSVMGRRGLPAEEVAELGVSAMVAHHKQPNALDEHLPDQLLPFMALAQGPSALTTSAITGHTLTNRAIVARFIEREVVITGGEGQPGALHVI